MEANTKTTKRQVEIEEVDCTISYQLRFLIKQLVLETINDVAKVILKKSRDSSIIY